MVRKMSLYTLVLTLISTFSCSKYLSNFMDSKNKSKYKVELQLDKKIKIISQDKECLIAKASKQNYYFVNSIQIKNDSLFHTVEATGKVCVFKGEQKIIIVNKKTGKLLSDLPTKQLVKTISNNKHIYLFFKNKNKDELAFVYDGEKTAQCFAGDISSEIVDNNIFIKIEKQKNKYKNITYIKKGEIVIKIKGVSDAIMTKCGPIYMREISEDKYDVLYNDKIIASIEHAQIYDADCYDDDNLVIVFRQHNSYVVYDSKLYKEREHKFLKTSNVRLYKNGYGAFAINGNNVSLKLKERQRGGDNQYYLFSSGEFLTGFDSIPYIMKNKKSFCQSSSSSASCLIDNKLYKSLSPSKGVLGICYKASKNIICFEPVNFGDYDVKEIDEDFSIDIVKNNISMLKDGKRFFVFLIKGNISIIDAKGEIFESNINVGGYWNDAPLIVPFFVSETTVYSVYSQKKYKFNKKIIKNQIIIEGSEGLVLFLYDKNKSIKSSTAQGYFHDGKNVYPLGTINTKDISMNKFMQAYIKFDEDFRMFLLIRDKEYHKLFDIKKLVSRGI